MAENQNQNADDDVSKSVSTLSDIARGMQHAVNTAQEIIEQHYMRLFARYFDKNGEPLMVTFNLTPEHVVNAPLVALIQPNALALEELTIEMAVEIDQTTVKKVPTPAKDIDLDRTSFAVSFASGKRTSAGQTTGGEASTREDNVIDVMMKFKRGDPPEGVARVLDEFYKAVVTQPREVPEKGQKQSPKVDNKKVDDKKEA